MTTNRIEIPLEGADVPVAFVTTVDGMEYIWSVEYNEDNDFYTFDCAEGRANWISTSCRGRRTR
jgi:hypothetical protein